MEVLRRTLLHLTSVDLYLYLAQLSHVSRPIYVAQPSQEKRAQIDDHRSGGIRLWMHDR